MAQDVLVVPCPDCGYNLEFEEPPEQGEKLTCPNCWAYLVVTALNPVQLTWDEEGDTDDWDEESNHYRG
jgi:hypothetical protein